LNNLRKLKLNINTWAVLSGLVVCLVILPNLNIFINAFTKPNENWSHITQYLLKEYVTNSLILVIFTALFAILIGISLSWIISAYDFPMRKFFKWAFILPLAIPPYIAAYTYNGLLNYTGVIQRFTREVLNIQVNQKYFDIMSIKGAIFIFTMFLFPYVYMITKSFLEKQSASLIENARLLGRNSFEIFFQVILPISRGAIIGGGSLVILEVLNDFGVVKYFGVNTFSTAIFKTWFGMGDVNSAIKLSAILMAMVFGFLILEKLLRGRTRYSYTTTKVRPIIRQKLKGIKAFSAFIFSFIIFVLSFLIPTLELIYWSTLTYKKVLNTKFLTLIFNSLSSALIATILIIIAAIIVANYTRISDGFISRFFSKSITLGYSIPGAVIAIGIIVFFIGLDQNLQWLYGLLGITSRKLVLSSSIVMLIFAYVIRFLAIGYNSIESGFEKIGKRFFEASRMLGMNVTETFFKVELKMIKPAMISGILLVFVDVLKELPLTLILRPFNYNTLATKANEYANDEMIHEASIPSLIIILLSVICIYLLYRYGKRRGEK
jgi:iron(III) transport system permease protein